MGRLWIRAERILPRPQTFEAELFFVIGERGGNVHGEEQGRSGGQGRLPTAFDIFLHTSN